MSVSYDRLGDLAREGGTADADRCTSSPWPSARSWPAGSGNTGFQRDLRFSHNKLGDLARAGQTADATRCTAVPEHPRGVGRRDPGNTGYQRDLSVSYNKLGDLARAPGDRGCADRCTSRP